MDYLVVPGKILSELQKSSADLDESSGFSRVLSPEGAKAAQLEEVRCAQLLLDQLQRREKLFEADGWVGRSFWKNYGKLRILELVSIDSRCSKLSECQSLSMRTLMQTDRRA